MSIREDEGQFASQLDKASSSKQGLGHLELRQELKKLRAMSDIRENDNSRLKLTLKEQREQNRLLRVQNHKLEEKRKETSAEAKQLKVKLMKETNTSKEKDFKIQSMDIELKVLKQNFEALAKESTSGKAKPRICNDTYEAKQNVQKFYEEKAKETEKEVQETIELTRKISTKLLNKKRSKRSNEDIKERLLKLSKL